MILYLKTFQEQKIKVSPKNWQTSKASIKKDWFIYYRLYDSKESKKGKLLLVKGMNHLKVWKERIEQTIKIISEETIRLDEKKLISKEDVLKDAINIYEIPPTTNFIQALELAEKRINEAASTKRDLKSILRYVSNAAESLNYKDLPINLISRKHFKHLLFYIDSTKGESIHRYNKIRSYLMIIYNEINAKNYFVSWGMSHILVDQGFAITNFEAYVLFKKEYFVWSWNYQFSSFYPNHLRSASLSGFNKVHVRFKR